ncbi:MAG TPA: PAS domain S-box protein [Candidatus Latescibacteria bacterium]|nr:PAS domain S-box protein [Candidatus Latescibacterota bacterium]
MSEGWLDEVLQSFRESTDGLRDAYVALRREVLKLNVELEERNRNLQRTLKEVQELKGYLSSVLESVANGVVVVNMEGKVTIFNRAAERITGYRKEEVLGRPYTEVFGADDGTPILETLRTGREVGTKREVSTRDGRMVPVDSSTALVTDGIGRKLGAVEVLRDLSEVRALEEQLERSRTMAALGEMAANVAHEVRNPLGAIGGYLELLERDMEEADPKRKLVRKMAEGLARLDRIVTNLLTYTRPLTPDLREMDLREVAEEALRFFQLGCDEKVKFSLEFSEPVRAYVDTELLQQVLFNLFSNAVQAMPEGGELKVRGYRDEGWACLEVSDSGMGMTEEVKRRAFDPFFTTKAKGVGLGLALVQKMVHLHGGEVSVESEPGKGSKFIVRIPSLR